MASENTHGKGKIQIGKCCHKTWKRSDPVFGMVYKKTNFERVRSRFQHGLINEDKIQMLVIASKNTNGMGKIQI